MRSVATFLTVLRIILVPFFIILYYYQFDFWGRWPALIVYAVAGISDYLDGYLARKFKETSAFGAFLDPVADKLMVAAVLIVVLQQNPHIWLMVCTLIIIGREIWISALREWMASMQMRDVVAVAKIGKWKTTLQMLALGFLIYREPFIGLPIWSIGQILMIGAALLTLYSMWSYNLSAWKAIKEK